MVRRALRSSSGGELLVPRAKNVGQTAPYILCHCPFHLESIPIGDMNAAKV